MQDNNAALQLCMQIVVQWTLPSSASIKYCALLNGDGTANLLCLQVEHAIQQKQSVTTSR